MRQTSLVIEVLRRVGFFPRACVWELTLACNLRCKHCGSIAGSKRGDELSLDECLRVADELVALGCRRITLSGGEPTMYPGWHEVGKRLVELGARVNLISNGLTWSAKHIEQAQQAGLCGVAFSIDGFEKEHDDFRAPGSFVGKAQLQVKLNMIMKLKIYPKPKWFNSRFFLL